MNRKARRALAVEQHAFVKELALPDRLMPVSPDQFPHAEHLPARAWLSKKYMVQLWDEPRRVKRLSVIRTKINTAGHWQDGLTWDELMEIKRELGFGDVYAVEIYPRDSDIVNVANMRHLFLLPEPLSIGWFK